MVFFHKSIEDSKRFSLNIHRGTVSELQTKDLRQYIYENSVDVLMLRIDSSSKEKQSEIFSLGFPVIHADTLVYYEIDLEKYQPKELKNELIFELVSNANRTVLSDIVPIIFNGYRNHYYSNKLLDKKQIIDGYTEWALNYFLDTESRISWLVRNKIGDLYGFATCSFNKENGNCEGVLYGVLPEKSGGGVYGDLIRFTQSYFKTNGFNKMVVSTQIQNFAVQKVWTREGFYINKSFDTYHINAFLNQNQPEFQKSFIVTNSEIDAFGKLSGDLNPIHFDDEYAKKSGFKSRIAHGIYFEMELTKILGMEWPGKGTIILSTKVIYNKPIYPDKKYSLSISIIEKNEKGFMELIAILGSEENIAENIAYIKVLKK